MESLLKLGHLNELDFGTVMDTSSNYKFEITFGLTLLTTVFAVYIAWRYTKRRMLQYTQEFATGTRLPEERTALESRENQVQQDENEEDMSTIHEQNKVFDPQTKIKLPKGCPMAHMFDLSKMSQSVLDQKQAETEEKSSENDGGQEEDSSADPQKYLSHIQSQVKRSQQRVALKKIQEEMSAEQKEKEREIQRQQLEAIFRMMEGHKEKFGVSSMDDMQSQVKLYM